MREETEMIKQLDTCCDFSTAFGNARLVYKVNEIVDVLNKLTAVHNISDVKPEKICKWQHYKLPTGYEHCVTDCGNDVSYITKWDYCPFCGGRIEITGEGIE